MPIARAREKMRFTHKELHFMAINEVNGWIDNPRIDVKSKKDTCPITNCKYCKELEKSELW